MTMTIKEHREWVDEDWILTKANALLYAFRRRFKRKPTPEDVISMRDCLTDILMAAGVKVEGGRR